MSNLAVGGIIPKGIAYSGVDLAGIAKDGSVVWMKDVSKTYYSFQTETNTQYYLDVLPEVGETGLNIYDEDLELIGTDGTCNTLTIGSTDYLAVQSQSLSLYIVRWSGNNDKIV